MAKPWSHFSQAVAFVENTHGSKFEEIITFVLWFDREARTNKIPLKKRPFFVSFFSNKTKLEFSKIQISEIVIDQFSPR